MANYAVEAAITHDPTLLTLRCRAVARMGHLLGACLIVCSRRRGLELMAFPARRRGR